MWRQYGAITRPPTLHAQWTRTSRTFIYTRLLYFQLNRLSPFNELHGHHVKFDRPFNAGHLVSANIVLCPTFCIFYRMLFVLSIRKYYWLLFFFGSVTDILVALIGVKCCMIVHIDPGQIFSPLRRYPRAPKCEFFLLEFWPFYREYLKKW